MSVMTQLHATCRSSMINSSADAKPLASYSNERSASTSAARNGASSSMTAIKGSFDTVLSSTDRGQSRCLDRQAICHGFGGDRYDRQHFWSHDNAGAFQKDLQHKVAFGHWLR